MIASIWVLLCSNSKHMNILQGQIYDLLFGHWCLQASTGKINKVHIHLKGNKNIKAVQYICEDCLASKKESKPLEVPRLVLLPLIYCTGRIGNKVPSMQWSDWKALKANKQKQVTFKLPMI